MTAGPSAAITLAGSGMQPLGMLRVIALQPSLGNIPAELVFRFTIH